MTRIYLIRHGQTSGNAQNTFQGSTDCPLNDIGREQAQHLGERVGTFPIDAVYSSPLSRAQETAKSASKHHKLQVETVPEIAEMCCGDWEGKNFTYIAQHYGEMQACWAKTPHLFQSPGGENMQGLYERMVSGILRIVKENIGKTVAVVSHGCAIRTFLCFAHGLPLDRLNEMPWVDNTSVSCIDFDDELNPTVIFENDYSHIPI